MEMLSTFLAHCEGIIRSPLVSPHKGPVMRSFEASFIVSLHRLLNRQSSSQWFEMPVAHVTSLFCYCLFFTPYERPYHIQDHFDGVLFSRGAHFVRCSQSLWGVSTVIWIIKMLLTKQIKTLCGQDYMGQVTVLWLSCYLVLLSTDSKTR